MNLVPAWLSRPYRGEEEMDRVEPPKVAEIPKPTGNGRVMEERVYEGPAEFPTAPHDLTLQEAATMIEKYQQDKANWIALAESAKSRIKDLDREIQFLGMELAETKNSLQSAQSQIEDLRQENSDLRALQAEQHALCKHLVARYENFHIPLPLRKRAKNGDKLKEPIAGEPVSQATPFPVKP